MSNRYNLYNFEASFRNFLLAENVNKGTLNSYLSDFRYFYGWLEQSQKLDIGLSEAQFVTKAMTPELLGSYRSFLLSSHFPANSVNRKLSALRKFGSFCISQGWLKENPGKKIHNFDEKPADENIHYFEKFKDDLLQQSKDEKNTNRINDVEEFVKFISS